MFVDCNVNECLCFIPCSNIMKVSSVNRVSFFENLLQYENIKNVRRGSCLQHCLVTVGMPINFWLFCCFTGKSSLEIQEDKIVLQETENPCFQFAFSS